MRSALAIGMLAVLLCAASPPARTAEAAQATESAKAAESVEPVKPVEGAKPAEPEKSAEPAKPAQAPAPAGGDCDLARELPADADPRSRRIACEIPLKYQGDVLIAENIGSLIRRHDMAAWLTSDELLKIGALKDFPGSPKGWLTDDRGDRIDVSYFSQDQDRLVSFARSSLQLQPFGVRDTRRLDPPRPASQREQRLMAAQTLARSQKPLYCSDAPPNMVVFDVEEDHKPQIFVFIMPPWQDDDVPMGGYTMFRMDQTGERLLDHYEQTRRCVNYSGARLRKAEAFYVSHVTSAAPTMFHVFMSLQYRKPLIVFTPQNQLLWKVELGRIRVLDSDDKDYKRARKWSRRIKDEREAVPTSSDIG